MPAPAAFAAFAALLVALPGLLSLLHAAGGPEGRPTRPGFGPVDQDGDGNTADVDCDDGDARVHPGAREDPTNGRDENCDGCVDERPSFEDQALHAWLWSSRELTTARADCLNGVDDDCDGLMDLEEESCLALLGEVACDDGVDNDENGLIDCADEACMGGDPCGPLLRVVHGGGSLLRRQRLEDWSAQVTTQLIFASGQVAAATAAGGMDTCTFTALEFRFSSATWHGFVENENASVTIDVAGGCPISADLLGIYRQWPSGAWRWGGEPRASWPNLTVSHSILTYTPSTFYHFSTLRAVSHLSQLDFDPAAGATLVDRWWYADRSTTYGGHTTVWQTRTYTSSAIPAGTVVGAKP